MDNVGYTPHYRLASQPVLTEPTAHQHAACSACCGLLLRAAQGNGSPRTVPLYATAKRLKPRPHRTCDSRATYSTAHIQQPKLSNGVPYFLQPTYYRTRLHSLQLGAPSAVPRHRSLSRVLEAQHAGPHPCFVARSLSPICGTTPPLYTQRCRPSGPVHLPDPVVHLPCLCNGTIHWHPNGTKSSCRVHRPPSSSACYVPPPQCGTVGPIKAKSCRTAPAPTPRAMC